MAEKTSELAADLKPASAESGHKLLLETITVVAGAAVVTFCMGAVVGAAWPAAVASCGISSIGVFVAYWMLKRL